ncbi:MAG: hypothetical protein IKP81_06540 [Paludibacteraceae bacterium]|nr:hypothetical protein [Paludibacteraceae bacterium]
MMRKLLQTIVLCGLPAAPLAQTLPVADRGGFVYELMRDVAEEDHLDLNGYGRMLADSVVRLPELAEPFNITSEYVMAYPDAKVADGMQQLSLPNSNYRGTAELELPILLPPVRHQMKPGLTLRYNSDMKAGNVGRGWHIGLPMISVDSLRSTDGELRFQWNGYGLDTTNSEDTKDTMYSYFTIKDRDWVFARRHFVDADHKVSYWKVTDTDTVKHTFGLVRQTDKGSDSILAVTAASAGKCPVEWLETYAENRYGDYIRYVYGTDPVRLDSVYIGRTSEQLPLVKLAFNWEKRQRTDTLTGYGDTLLQTERIRKITILYLNDFYTADEIPEGEEKLYRTVRTYTFDLEKKHAANLLETVTVAHVDGASPYSYRFSYYDDADSVRHYKAFRDNFYSIKADSVIVDRTGLLQTVHSPLGGCATVDYGYAALPRCRRDSNLVYNTEADTLYRFRHDRDTLLHTYFHGKDSVARKMVMKSLWVNDAVGADGRPSKNTFAYGKAYLDFKGRFAGFGSVTTTNLNTQADTFAVYRTVVKQYDTTHTYWLPYILAVSVSDADGKLLQEKTYGYDFVPEFPDSLFRMLDRRTLWRDGLSEKWVYTYPGKMERILLTKAEHYASLSADTPDKVIEYNYSYGRLTKAELKTGSSLKRQVAYSYADKRHFTLPTSMVWSVDGENTTSTDFTYDADGNMTSRTLHGTTDLEYRYRYDRRLNLFIERVEDSHGYRTEFGDYDYYYGKPQRVTDMNGKVLWQKFDAMGRMDTVVAPIEVENGTDYSIRYVYNQPNKPTAADSISNTVVRDTIILNVPSEIYLGNVPDSVADSVKAMVIANLFGNGYSASDFMFCDGLEWANFDTFNIVVDTGRIVVPECHCNDKVKPHMALTLRYNALYPGKDKDQRFATYADGFGRTIQEQEEMEVFKFAKLTDKVGVARKFVARALNTYDPYARRVAASTKVVGGKNTNYIAPNSNNYYWHDVSFDILDRQTRSFGGETIVYGSNGNATISRGGEEGELQTDIDGRILRNTLPISSIRMYNPLGELEYEKRGLEETAYEYDMLGRLVKKHNNQRGVTVYKYDQLGNLVGRYNADSTIYVYDGRLLTDVLYSKYPTNNVHFVYGDPNAPFNRVGRIAMATDASGVREFYYGNNGAVQKDIRTLILPDSTVETYRTQYEYDTWGRMGRLVYPDQESLTYSYNINGLPDTVTGSKSYSYQYVFGATYDEYGNNTRYQSCNGTETRRMYDYPGLRMNQMRVTDRKGNTLFNLSATEGGISVSTDSVSMQLATSAEPEGHKWEETATLTVGGETSTYSNSANFNEYLLETSAQRGFGNLSSPYDEEGTATWDYRYNKAGQLTAVVGSARNGGIPALLRSYDQQGNLASEAWTLLGSEQELEETVTVAGLDTKVFAYNEDDKQTALADNGYVTTYWYDAFGWPAIKTDGGQASVYVNGVGAANATYTPDYTLYVNRYFEKNSSGLYTKHVWLGGERIASKEGNPDSYGSNPALTQRAGEGVDGAKVRYDSLLGVSIRGIGLRYAAVGARYTAETVKAGNPYSPKNANVDNGNDSYEDRQFYYHADQGGRAVLVTNLKAEGVERALFSSGGEVLHLSHSEGWFTPYIYRGGLFDTGTGLYSNGCAFWNPWFK